MSADRDRHASKHLEVEAGCRHDDIGGELFTGLELHAGRGEVADASGHDRRRSLANHVEHVAVRDQAQTLIPWAVGRREVLVETELGSDTLEEDRLDLLGPLPSHVEEEAAERSTLLPPGGHIGRLVGERAAQTVRDLVLGRTRHHVRR